MSHSKRWSNVHKIFQRIPLWFLLTTQSQALSKTNGLNRMWWTILELLFTPLGFTPTMVPHRKNKETIQSNVCWMHIKITGCENGCHRTPSLIAPTSCFPLLIKSMDSRSGKKVTSNCIKNYMIRTLRLRAVCGIMTFRTSFSKFRKSAGNFPRENTKLFGTLTPEEANACSCVESCVLFFLCT
jgi:hypothetical protein